MLTDKQREVYEFLRDFQRRTGYAPSVREIANAVRLSSTSTVQLHLNTLEKLGYISRSGGKTRAITIEEPEGVPILGEVAAGSPILAVEDALGYLPWGGGNGEEYFALKIRGESMINAGILDGDMVVVKRQQTAKNGEIVIALLGDGATCKRFKKTSDGILLMPENEDYDPIDGDGVTILGRVTAVIRTY